MQRFINIPTVRRLINLLSRWAAWGAEPTQVTCGEIEPQCVLWRDNSGLCVLWPGLRPVTLDLRAAVIAIVC